MDLRKINVYYLEDLISDFECLSKKLTAHEAIVHPATPDERTNDLEKVIEYLGNSQKGRKKLKTELQRLFAAKNIQLFILDLFLKGDDAGFRSIDLYSELLRTDDKLKNIPVIFLTRESDQTKVLIDGEADYIKKPAHLNDENVNEVYGSLLEKAAKFSSLVTAFSENSAVEGAKPDAMEVIKVRSGEKSAKLSFGEWLTVNF